MRWAKRVAQMGRKRNAYRLGCETLKGRENVEDISVVGAW